MYGVISISRSCLPGSLEISLLKKSERNSGSRRSRQRMYEQIADILEKRPEEVVAVLQGKELIES